jgi:hypothetical protein
MPWVSWTLQGLDASLASNAEQTSLTIKLVSIFQAHQSWLGWTLLF